MPVKNINSKTILVVDNDSAARMIIEKILVHEGHGAVQAISGNEALAFLKSYSIDLVVSDIQMDDGDGVDLLRNMRSQIMNAPPLLFVSAQMDHTETELLQLGAVAYIAKPFSMADFLSKIRIIL